MASKYRALVAKRSIKNLKGILKHDIYKIPKFHHIVQNTSVESCRAEKISIKLPTAVLLEADDKNITLSKFIEDFETDDLIRAITSANCDESSNQFNLQFHISKNRFIRDVICESICLEVGSIKQSNNLLLEHFYDNEQERKDRIVIDFSSPNVAKPFHMGHLRSTIIGNFIANIHEVVGHNVVRLNYLGDWGTQFGYLMAGLKHHQIENITDLEKLCDTSTTVINKLNEIYVEANSLAENDPELNKTAKNYFACLESGDSTLIKQWELIRNITVEELEKTYKRLNVSIDVYHGESMYSNQHNNVTNLLEKKGLLVKLEDGRAVVKIKNTNDSHKNVIIKKSDGSSLYITRDIAAAIDRKTQFDFDKMLYVVEKAQSDHFKNLFEIMNLMEQRWSQGLKHISFGRIKGMSSRKGTSVFLSDILDEGQSKMIEQQKRSPNTKVTQNDGDFHEIADILAISAVVCNDLKQKKSKDYSFNWENVLHSKGDSGIKLQYTHARLTSLLLNMSLLNDEYKFEEGLLGELTSPKYFNNVLEPEAIELVQAISIYDEIVHSSYINLEPCILVNYLYRLCNTTSKGLKVLGVKTARNQQAANERLVLFAAARAVLRSGMKILGLKPLDRI